MADNKKKSKLDKLYPTHVWRLPKGPSTQENRIMDPAEAAAEDSKKALSRGDLQDIEKKGAKLTDEIVKQEDSIIKSKSYMEGLEKRAKAREKK